ncbi:flavin reductase family protein [Ponticaulis sp.]|uniref:flavin reductase family protein n=1 Tax=Ponticaulis sp. TaxID=2020902 RepID=UPI0026188D02|nr:flavin reductase family protein [Ponticaulis sp.]MDF1679118.1 flavin reductase family protein [Ponticaulis sp.]
MTATHTGPHFYEPKNGHGLPHDPFNAIVGPRPIGWIGSLSASGVPNLAPYSFFNAFNYTPPIIGFASVGSKKDSFNNIEETGEFTWNLVTRELAEAMNESCAPISSDESEFDRAKLEQGASRVIKAPRVAASPVSFECKLTQIVQLTNHEGKEVPSWVVFGEVVGVHIAEGVLENGIYDPARMRTVLRAGGPASYYEITPDNRFEMYRPKA